MHIFGLVSSLAPIALNLPLFKLCTHAYFYLNSNEMIFFLIGFMVIRSLHIIPHALTAQWPNFVAINLLAFESWWRHQMETFSALLAFCAENSPSPVNSPHKTQWRGAWMFSLICTWINSWVNNPEAGDLRRHRTHCDVSVMWIWNVISIKL